MKDVQLLSLYVEVPVILYSCIPVSISEQLVLHRCPHAIVISLRDRLVLGRILFTRACWKTLYERRWVGRKEIRN